MVPDMSFDVQLAWFEIHRAFVTAATSILTALIVLGGGLFVGQKITAKWNIRIKQRELDLDAIRQVRSLYGEFLSTQRLWNYHCEHCQVKILDDRGLKLFNRACMAEGQMEAILMKVASERKLTSEQLDTLGLYRQGYQQLRESIQKNGPLSWGSSEHPEYVAFKRGCRTTIDVLSKAMSQAAPSGQFEYITSNIHEIRWKALCPRIPEH
jgi:hypothetical protein